MIKVPLEAYGSDHYVAKSPLSKLHFPEVFLFFFLLNYIFKLQFLAEPENFSFKTILLDKQGNIKRSDMQMSYQMQYLSLLNINCFYIFLKIIVLGREGNLENLGNSKIYPLENLALLYIFLRMFVLSFSSFF